MDYDPQLLSELARCYVQAALNELLRESARTAERDDEVRSTIEIKDRETAHDSGLA